jgi:lysozyme
MSDPVVKRSIVLVTAALISAVTALEGVKYVPYEDIVNVWTVCAGYAGKDVVRNKVYTPAECNDLTTRELTAKGQAVLACTKVPISQNEYEAYTLFAYNVGTGAYCGSSLLKRLNAGDHVGACNGLMAWDMAGGKHVEGLRNRREYERRLCLGGS